MPDRRTGPAGDAEELEITPQELIERAITLRPMLLERQAEVEERTYYSQEMHAEFQKAGFYRMFMPRRYGGSKWTSRRSCA